MPWEKGKSGNPKGRPKGRQNKHLVALHKAIKEVEEEKGEKLWKRVVKMAWNDAKLMTAILKKILPDVQQSKIDVSLTSHDDWVKKLEAEEAIELEINGTDGKSKEKIPAKKVKKVLSLIR